MAWDRSDQDLLNIEEELDAPLLLDENVEVPELLALKSRSITPEPGPEEIKEVEQPVLRLISIETVAEEDEGDSGSERSDKIMIVEN